MISYLTSIILLIVAWNEGSALLTVSAALFAIAGSISMSNVDKETKGEEYEQKN